MTIEFRLSEEETILLRPYNKGKVQGKLYFDLIDNDQKVWMELMLVDQNLKVINCSPKIIDNKNAIISKLDELYYEIVNVEKSGTDSYNENDFIELNPYDPDKIKVRTDKISITLIHQMIHNGDIELNPDFQRNFVWNSLQKSRLIESILLRIPLPMFYFAEDKDGKLTIVDGLQRITTIRDFMNNKFPLKNLQYLEENCSGKYYFSEGKKQGIDLKYYRWFNLTTLSANIIDPASPSKVKYDIFRRINTGGKPLNNQEIRNCLTSQGLRDVLNKMVSLSEFKSATDNSIKNTRMDDQEIALRFLVFYEMMHAEGIESYNGYMESTLDEYTELKKKSTIQELDKFIMPFSYAMKNAEYLIGRKYAFRKITPTDLQPNAYKQLINKALFVCISILLADLDHEQVRSKNVANSLQMPLANLIRKNFTLSNFLSFGTNGRANILYTYKELSELFKNNVNV